MMNSQLDRLLFIINTRIAVAKSNFAVKQTFSTDWENQKKAGIAIATVLLLATIGGFMFNKNPLVGESTASIQSTAAKNTEPVAQLQQKAKKQIKQKEAKKLEKDMAITEEMIDPTKSYAVAVDKSRQLLYILQDEGDMYKVIHSYRVSTGLTEGRKELEGDLKTPEGIYHITRIKEDADLESIYGPRAYVLNYPNRHDLQDGRTGSGIWLHGTGIGVRTPDTKGCVELTDKNIMRIGKWAKQNTTVAIFSKSFPLPVENGMVEKKFISEQFYYTQIHGKS